jgi:hypothetical protein
MKYIILNLIKLQEDNLTKNIEKGFFVLDDYIADNEMRTNIIKKLAIMGRHYNITTILTTHGMFSYFDCCDIFKIYRNKAYKNTMLFRYILNISQQSK